MDYTLGFIGAGNMAEAIARGAVERGVLPAAQMIASDVSKARRELFASLGIAVTTDNARVIANSRQIVLAVKPQTLPQVAADLAGHVTDEHVVVSIMAGVGSAKLAATVNAARPSPAPLRVVRVMPNTPLLVGLGMSGVALGAGARQGDEELAMRLFGSAGRAILVPECAIDAITAVSGSGPAYLFYLAEAMEKAARELGLAEHARTLVQQTLLGAATLLAQSPEPADVLRRKVTSPGGTTEAAVKHLDGNKSVDVIVNAIKAAERRSKELGA